MGRRVLERGCAYRKIPTVRQEKSRGNEFQGSS